MNEQYYEAREGAFIQLVDELEKSIGLNLAVFGFDAGDIVADDLLPLHPLLTPELSESERNNKIIESVNKIFSALENDIKKEYPERLDQLTKENLGES